ncbi:MAG: DNA repair protein RecN [Eubacteriales bacterium]|jgi:DNA repair protein RecN (Recombination protein N)
MLSLLHIENVAVIEKVDIAFQTGFNVLTGETGAGKSIIIDSINMVLGERTSREIIRKGQQRALVCACFAELSSQVLEELEQQGLQPDEDGNLLLERELSVQGKGSCRINGRPVSTAVLRQIAGCLINIHGQHDSQQLLQSERHIQFLDGYLGLEPELSRYRPLYEEDRRLRRELQNLQQGEQERERRMDLLRYQIREIQRAQLTPGEEEELTARRRVLRNAERIRTAVEETFALVYEGDEEFQSVHDLLAQAQESLSDVARLEDTLASCAQTLENMSYELEDVVENLREVRESMEVGEEELEEIENRLEVLTRLKRKYGSDVEEILDFEQNCRQELEKLENSHQDMEALTKALNANSQALQQQARALHEKRLEGAKRLQEGIERELKFLNMENAKFSVRLEQHTDDEGNPIYRPSGVDDVEFMIQTNRGEDMKPLAKIASGGELSRIMLALKSSMTQADPVDTLIFDEIDTGISGRAASRVGEKLREISKYRQVLCVSHLVTIAAKASHHFLISKDDSEHTRTTVQLLQGQRRVDEIARLIGGEEITDITLANARQLLEQSE